MPGQTDAVMAAFIPRQIYGIIGRPLEHSLSPLVHNWGFQALGLEAAYLSWPLADSRLQDFILAARTLPISGLSVTIPYKQRIIAHLDGCTAQALEAGAVNTVYWDAGRLWGENTDIQGFLSPLDPSRWQALRGALVLGNGGAARAALTAMAGAGVGGLAVSGRNPERSAVLAGAFGVKRLDWKDRGRWSGELLVNATPLGMAGMHEASSPWPGALPEGISMVYDLVYNPLRTRLLIQAEKQGIPTVGGLEMFLGQASAQFALWTGKTLPLNRLREVVAARLASAGKKDPPGLS